MHTFPTVIFVGERV